ncbi:hypothetical protein RHMOL_Rhmol13G0304200 [Rhododendron molle]|uniref:Uncharacterized protein n=1 Tax=Rhododendron molle TaxID=49168 RepID=A0ACC0LC94_RHOML|nr:hypothetical protein RHMOL_Rhmol13G0304200 [Rhododendron molle]
MSAGGKLGVRSGNSSWGSTIFVCDLPEDMDEVWLKQIFSGAGKITQAYSPRKRSFRLNQRFGFVRFENKADGLRAIKMWNTAQIQGHRLLVKEARFNNTRWNNQGQTKVGESKVYRARMNKNPRDEANRWIPKSPKAGNGAQLCIKVSEEGNEWLTRSAIATLSPLRSMVYMEDRLRNLGYSDIQAVGAVGGCKTDLAARDSFSSSLGIGASVRGSGKVWGFLGEGVGSKSLPITNLAPLTVIGLNRLLLSPRASLSNLVENQNSLAAKSVSWVANSVNENPTPPGILSEREDDDANGDGRNHAEDGDGRLDHYDANHAEEDHALTPLKAAINGVKGKKKRKTIHDILGFTKVDMVNNKGRKNKQKCEVFRSAIAAVALSASISSGGIVNRNRLILDEAQAIWECNKIMGLGYDGNEDEVISRLADMEAQDLDRADRAAARQL